QLVKVMDPLLREKILGLIANEIEKEMVVSKEAFKVVDPVYLVKNSKAIKLYPIAFGACLFLIIAVILFILHAFSSAAKNDQDKLLLTNIKKEMHNFL
ncbi:MAG: hypothetical protein ABSF80_07105, partial [Chitinispirillaceae bacterium]